MIAEFIKDLAQDKKDHVILGVLTGFPLMFIGFAIGGQVGINIAGFIAIFLYALKEIVHDKIQGKGKAEFMDWFWNSVPVFQILIISNLQQG